MKKLTSLALAILLTLVSLAAFADDMPSRPQVNPKQRGYSAYTQTTEGRKERLETKETQQSTTTTSGTTVNPKQSGYTGPLTSYVPPAPVYTPPQYPIPQYPIPAIPYQPWIGLSVGQYFALDGQVYMVAYYTTIGYSTVMVAYLVNTYGYADPLFPRYFYL